jgi:hypothetical protein
MVSTGQGDEMGARDTGGQPTPRVGGEFMLQNRGVIEIKGKGEMQTWFLIGRKGLA